MSEVILVTVLVVTAKDGEYDYWLTVKSSKKSTPYLGHFERPKWRAKYTTASAAKSAGRKMAKRLGWTVVDEH